MALAVTLPADAEPLRIMPVGDSITAGYTDNPAWNATFDFGYRSRLYHLLSEAGYDFVFVGKSAAPFNFHTTRYGDPAKGGTVRPAFDLRDVAGVDQNGHRGYGGIRIPQMTKNITGFLAADAPDIILLMIGINKIGADSPGQLDKLVGTIFTEKPDVHLIIAQITPRSSYVENIVGLNTHIRETLVPRFRRQGRNISTVDQYRNFLSDPADPRSINPALFSNQVNHPNKAAYDAMASTWFEGILAVIPPTLPVLDSTSVPPAIKKGGMIGKFTQPPAPSTARLVFSLVEGAGDTDNAKFTISGDELRAGSYDFGSDPEVKSYQMRATATPGGPAGERAITLR